MACALEVMEERNQAMSILNAHIYCHDKKRNLPQTETMPKIQEAQKVQEVLMIWKSIVQSYLTG
jgi:hypothetical protein